MRFVFFSHSLLSDWSHRSAHFLRGVVSELAERGHRVCVFEPVDAWSVQNLVHEHGEEALALTTEHYPALQSRRYDRATLDLDEALDGVDVVIVHEWSSHDLRAAHRRPSKALAFALRAALSRHPSSSHHGAGRDGALRYLWLRRRPRIRRGGKGGARAGGVGASRLGVARGG